MLVMESGGLWPEFQLLSFEDSKKGVGCDPKKPKEAQFVTRDPAGGTRLLLIPALNTRAGSGKPLFPPMLTEVENYRRSAQPFFLFNLAKREFLVPGVKPGDRARWLSADATDRAELSVGLRLRGTQMVVCAEGVSSADGAAAVLWADERRTHQRFKVDGGRVSFVHSGKCLGVWEGRPAQYGCEDSRAAAGWAFDDSGRVRLANTGLVLTATPDARGDFGKDLTLAPASDAGAAAQLFDRFDDDACAALEYGEAEILRGEMPPPGCSEPWYIYEMNTEDPIV
jgi:hypothetical protein